MTIQTVLRVGDLAESTRFYRAAGPFAVAVLGSDLAQVTGAGNASFLLAGARADLSPWPEAHRSGAGAFVYLHQPDLPGLAASLGAKALVEPYPGYRHLLVPDPDGYVLAFWESLPLTDAQVLDIYAIGPGRLRAALVGADLDRAWASGKWTVRQIAHHLVDSDLSTFHVLRMALALPGHTIQSTLWSPDDWMTGLDGAARPVGPAVALLEASRAWVLEVVGHLPGALDRWVAWPSGYRAEVRDLLRQVGGHALHHIIQIEETRNR